MWLRPKGLKVFSYVERCAEFKNQSLKKSAGTQSCYVQWNTPGVLGSRGEGLFIFRELGSTANYLRGAG